MSLALLPVVLTCGLTLCGPPAAGGWVAPVGAPSSPTTVIHPFDPPASAYGAGHRGVDLLSTPGAPVRATADGLVTYAGVLAGRGVVTVTHGQLRSTYEPVDPAVRVGQRVRAGDVIGHLSAGPGHCGLRSCLHWGVLLATRYLDPLSFLAPARVRLLPVWGVAAPSRFDSVLDKVTDAVLDTDLPTRSRATTKRPRGMPAESSTGSDRTPSAAGATVGALGLAGAGVVARRRRR